MTRSHFFNGRVLVRARHGGVHRFASEVVKCTPSLHVVSPRAAPHPWSARLWEQTTLYRETRDGVLLSVAHGGPVRHARHVVVVHDVLPLTRPSSVNPLFSSLQRRQLPVLVARAARVVAPSRRVAQEISALFGLDRDRLAVIPPGVADSFRPGDRHQAKLDLGLDPICPVVAAVLDAAPRKNGAVVAALLAALRLERPEVQIVVAGGRRPEPFAHRMRAPEIELPASAVDLGVVSDEGLATMYRSADVFVSLSSGEGFGLPVVEAAASGAAVVTTSVPSVDEHARGAVEIVDDAQSAHRVILELLASPQRRSELAERAQEQLRHLRWPLTATRLQDLMSDVS